MDQLTPFQVYLLEKLDFEPNVVLNVLVKNKNRK